MSKRILVVEDQEDNRQILRDLLTSADFEVIEAEDGEAGLAAAAAHRPDLILMDIQLPRCCMPSRSSPSPLMH
jgi:two-component system, cell cycle response regulator DivK